MALVQCPDCGQDVSTTAASCPRCGRPNSVGPETCSHPTLRRQDKDLSGRDVVTYLVFVVVVTWLGGTLLTVVLESDLGFPIMFVVGLLGGYLTVKYQPKDPVCAVCNTRVKPPSHKDT